MRERKRNRERKWKKKDRKNEEKEERKKDRKTEGKKGRKKEKKRKRPKSWHERENRSRQTKREREKERTAIASELTCHKNNPVEERETHTEVSRHSEVEKTFLLLHHSSYFYVLSNARQAKKKINDEWSKSRHTNLPFSIFIRLSTLLKFRT